MSKKSTIKVLSSLSKAVTMWDVNVTCPWLTYQPRLPEKAKKRKK